MEPDNPTIKVGEEQQFTVIVTTNPPDAQIDEGCRYAAVETLIADLTTATLAEAAAGGVFD